MCNNSSEKRDEAQGVDSALVSATTKENSSNSKRYIYDYLLLESVGYHPRGFFDIPHMIFDVYWWEGDWTEYVKHCDYGEGEKVLEGLFRQYVYDGGIEKFRKLPQQIGSNNTRFICWNAELFNGDDKCDPFRGDVIIQREWEGHYVFSKFDGNYDDFYDEEEGCMEISLWYKPVLVVRKKLWDEYGTRSNIFECLSGMTQGYYGAFWDRVDEVRCEDCNIMYTSTTKTTKDSKLHIDREYKKRKNDKVTSADVKGPRKTLDKSRYCDDIPLEFVNRYGGTGSLCGSQNYINQYVVDENDKFWLYKFDRKQLEEWAKKNVRNDNGHYFNLKNVGKGKLMWVPLTALTDPRTPVSYTKSDVDDYVKQVYGEVMKNGINCLDRLNPFV